VTAAEAGAPYLALMIASFALHALLISFVLGGAGYVLARLIRGGDDALAAASRDWLPFALGAAITAGVAPLLFVQIVYQPRFYTANLLLFVRWLAIVPALIVGFYALYLGKSARAAAWPRRWRGAVAALALGCFVFVAWSWIEDHALAMQRDPATWAAHYGRAALRHRDSMIAPRLVMWLGLAAAIWPAGLLIVAPGAALAERRRAAAIALVGLVIAGAAAIATGVAIDGGATVLDLAAARSWLYGLARVGAGAAPRRGPRSSSGARRLARWCSAPPRASRCRWPARARPCARPRSMRRRAGSAAAPTMWRKR
jgi:hypothetical protein